jgi:hypothetical protein
MAGLVGIAALARVLARRSAGSALPPATEPEPDLAGELRRKLSETRGAAGAGGPIAPPQSLPDAPTEPQESLEERRSRVHAKAQEAIDAMRDEPA